MSSSEVVVCPKLEELVLVLIDREVFDIEHVIGRAAARASRGAKLKSVRIVGQDEIGRNDMLELEKHGLCEKYGPEADEANDGGHGSGVEG
jgi:hypothetical protein